MEQLFELLDQSPVVFMMTFFVVFYAAVMTIFALSFYSENKKLSKHLNK